MNSIVKVLQRVPRSTQNVLSVQSTQKLSSWTKPNTESNRLGFEITGYAFNNPSVLSKWEKPSVESNRLGFEITGYAFNNN